VKLQHHTCQAIIACEQNKGLTGMLPMENLPKGFYLPGASCNLKGGEELFITLQKFSKRTMDS
jgi:hypothetical protein